MDVAQVLRELWRRRVLMVLGVVVAIVAALASGYRLSVLPPGLSSKSLSINTANTSVLIDTQDSAIGNVLVDLRPLVARASVYTRYMTTLPVRRAIAAEAGIPLESLVADAPFGTNIAREASQPVAADRSQGLLEEQRRFYLRFTTDSGLPLVLINANAPSLDEAVALADAGAQGFIEHIKRVEDARRVPVSRRVILRQLGSAEGGTVASNVKTEVMVATFLGVLVAWALLVLLVTSIARSWRELDGIESA